MVSLFGRGFDSRQLHHFVSIKVKKVTAWVTFFCLGNSHTSTVHYIVNKL